MPLLQLFALLWKFQQQEQVTGEASIFKERKRHQFKWIFLASRMEKSKSLCTSDSSKDMKALLKLQMKPSKVTHAYSPSTNEVETRGMQVQAQIGIHSKALPQKTLKAKGQNDPKEPKRN